MGRGTRTSSTDRAPLVLRRPLPAGHIPAWRRPAPLPPRARAREEVAVAYRAVARAVGHYRARARGAMPHPVHVHDDEPLVTAALRLAVAETARALYVTPARAAIVLGETAIEQARQRILGWLRRELSAQRPGVGEMTSEEAFDVFADQLSQTFGAVDLVAGRAAGDLPALLSPDQWRRFLDVARSSDDPCRTLYDLVVGAPGA